MTIDVVNLEQNLEGLAPPPPGSQLAKSVRQLAEKAEIVLKVPSLGQMLSLYVQVDSIHKRWATL